MPVFSVSSGQRIYLSTPAPQRDARKREQERFKEQHPVPEIERPDTYLDRAIMSSLTNRKKADYGWARRLDEAAKREKESDMARKAAGSALSKNSNSQMSSSLPTAASSLGTMKPPNTPKGQIGDAAIALPKAASVPNDRKWPNAGASAPRSRAAQADSEMQDLWTEADQGRVFSVLLQHGDMFCKVEGALSLHEANFFRHTLSAMPSDLSKRIGHWYRLHRLVSDWSKNRLDKADEGSVDLEPPQSEVDELIDRWVKLIHRRFCYLNRRKIVSGLWHGIQPLLEEHTLNQIRGVLTEMHGSLIQEIRDNNVVSETFQNSQPSFVEERCGEMARGNFTRVVRPAVLQRVEGFARMLESWDSKLQDKATQSLLAAPSSSAPASDTAKTSPELGCMDARGGNRGEASRGRKGRRSEPESESGSEYQVSSDGSDSDSSEGSVEPLPSPVLPSVEEPDAVNTPPCSPALRQRLEALELEFLRQLRAKDDGNQAPTSTPEARHRDAEDSGEAAGRSWDFPIVVAPTPTRRVTPPRTVVPVRTAKRLIPTEASGEETTPTRRRQKRRDLGARVDLLTPSLSSPPGYIDPGSQAPGNHQGEDIAQESTAGGPRRSDDKLLRDLERRLARLEKQNLE